MTKKIFQKKWKIKADLRSRKTLLGKKKGYGKRLKGMLRNAYEKRRQDTSNCGRYTREILGYSPR